MSRYFFPLVIILFIFSFVIFAGLKMISRPSIEYDEGAYLTTFLLLDKGDPPYQKTFFSQLPGFFYSTFPGFLLFGKTLEAGRLTIFFWSLVGLLGILWLAYEAGNILFGILAIIVLYNLQLFFDQSLTFHADSIPFSFSVFSLATMLRFRKSKNFIWFILSSLFFSFAILIKLEASVMLSLILIFLTSLYKRKTSLIKILLSLFIFFILPFILLYFSLLPFGGFTPFYKSAVLVRLGVMNNNSSFPLFSYLLNSKQLFFVIASSLILSIYGIFKLKKDDRFLFLIILSWSLIILFSLFIYRPLFFHHLVLLSVPFSLLFSYLLISFLKQLISIKILTIFIVLLIFYSMLNLINYSNNHSQKFSNRLEEKGIEIISKNTKPDDYVVSDEGFLNAYSKRLPPPWLVDISDARVISGALTGEEFENEILRYKPKLVMSWSGRIRKISNFYAIMKKANYKVLEVIDKDHEAFILSAK